MPKSVTTNSDPSHPDRPGPGRPRSAKPSELEYAILQVLWGLGSGTVRDVHTRLSATREIGYTSILKTLQIMTDKRLVLRDDADRAHIYTPAFSEEATQGGILTDLLQRVFGGSAHHLVLRALQVQPASRAEREEIRRLLDRMEETKEDQKDDQTEEEK